MTTKGSRRNQGITSTTAQRTAEISAACYDELPQRDSSAAAEIDVNQPLEAIRAAEAENSTHRKAPFRDFLSPTLPVAPPARDDLSSLSHVSFSRTDENNHHRLYTHINEPQNLAILTKTAPRSWHRAVAPHRAMIAVKARSERKLSGSRARARLCLSSHHSADRRRETLAMLCSLLC